MTNISKTNYDVFKKFVPAAPAGNDFHHSERRQDPDRLAADFAGPFLQQLLHLPGDESRLPALPPTTSLRPFHLEPQSILSTDNAPTCRCSGPLPQRFYLAPRRTITPSRPTVTNELRLAYNRFSQFYVTRE